MNGGIAAERAAVERARLRAAGVALLVGVLLLAVKLIAAWITGSKALLSDGLESIVNVLAASIALAAIHWGRQPADSDHPFGHGKIEAVSAGLEGGALLSAAIAIAWFAVPAFWSHEPLEALGFGSAVTVGTAVVNLLVGRWLVRRGKALESPALRADGKHLIADAASSIGVLVGLVLVAWTDQQWIDPLAACVMALWVGYTGLHVVRAALGHLLDERPTTILRGIADRLAASPPIGLVDAHDLRVIDAVTERFVALHVVAPRHWTLAETADLRVALSNTLSADSDVTVSVAIQMEACLPRHCAQCPVEACSLRSEQRTRHPAFHRLEAVAAPHPPPDAD